MADFLMFTEGKNEVINNGFPATCYFLLSTKSVGATTPFSGTETSSGSLTESYNVGGATAGGQGPLKGVWVG